MGRLLWGKLSGVIPVGALVMSGFDVLALLLFAVIVYRHARHSTIDGKGWVDAPPPMTTFAWLTVVAVVWMAAFGLAQGGSSRFALWQMNRSIYVPMVYLLMKQGLRGPADARVVRKIILAVGVFRALEAITFRWMYPSSTSFPTPPPTTSVLFTTCVAILGALLLEMPRNADPRPGARSSNRTFSGHAGEPRGRLGRAGVVAFVFWLITPGPAGRRSWQARPEGGGPAAALRRRRLGLGVGDIRPVKKLRSLTDSEVNTSTLWRDWENYDLIYTYSQEAPVLGSGFGRPFIQKVKLPDVTKFLRSSSPTCRTTACSGSGPSGGSSASALHLGGVPGGACSSPSVPTALLAQPAGSGGGFGGGGSSGSATWSRATADLGFGAWGPIFTLGASYDWWGRRELRPSPAPGEGDSGDRVGGPCGADLPVGGAGLGRPGHCRDVDRATLTPGPHRRAVA